MIDENKLIKEVQAHQEFWINNAITSLAAGDIFNEERCTIMVGELNDILDMIKNQPKVGEWIPCDVGVGAPKYNEDVEVTTKNGERQIGHYAGGCWYDSINGDYIQVIAWKEPSEPWEGGSE